MAPWLAGLLLAASSVRARSDQPAPVVAVLSSDIGPYREALAGLREELGQDVPALVLSKDEPDIPSSAQVVVAFGSKAATQNYPKRARLIAALAPGMVTADEATTTIPMVCEPLALAKAFKRLAPKLNTLAVLWVSPSFREYANELEARGPAEGVSIRNVALATASDLPEELRRLYGTIDAIWLAPDPLLANATSLSILVEFSRQNKIPLFVATEGLLEEGATASIGPTIREIGRLTASVARKSLKGEPVAGQYYPATAHIVVAKKAAARTGLVFLPASLSQEDKVLP